ncbi:hypothetical protein LUZ60_006377 [Juncus effusus]|nr:hypothetical protein LUZ60_006377 [Juncus effusus]
MSSHNYISVICANPDMMVINGVWEKGMDKIPEYALTTFFLQTVFYIIASRVLGLVLVPILKQPRMICDILAGFIFGSGVIIKSHSFNTILNTKLGTPTLELVGYFGLMYMIFLAGVKLDTTLIKGIEKKFVVTAAINLILPFTVTFLAGFGLGIGEDVLSIPKSVIRKIFQKPDDINYTYDSMVSDFIGLAEGKRTYFLFFVSLCFSLTSFPTLLRLVTDLKIVSTEPGRLALSASVVSELLGWVFLAVLINLWSFRPWAEPVYLVCWAVIWIVFCLTLVRPVMVWVSKRMPTGDQPSNSYIGLVLVSVAGAGLLNEIVGMHAAFGVLVFGLAMPAGPLAVALVDRSEEFMGNFMLPFFFITIGLTADFGLLDDESKMMENLKGFWSLSPNFIMLAGIAMVCKVVTGLFVSIVFWMPAKDGLALGVLLCSKGALDYVILGTTIMKDVFNHLQYTVVLVGITLTAAMVSPLATFLYRPSRPKIMYRRRNLQRAKHDGELRMISCVHNYRNVPAIITLLEASNPTKRSPIFVYVLHLIELIGRASAMLIVHNPGSKSNKYRPSHHTVTPHRGQQQAELIATAFENYEQHAGGVSVQPLTAVSPYENMHEDICTIAEDRHAAVILLPFHKILGVGGDLETISPSIRTVNQNVLARALCSVAILVDRGLGANSQLTTDTRNMQITVALLFFGGPDDREALSYAWRMADHPGVSIMVLRFIPGTENNSSISLPRSGTLTMPELAELEEQERQRDDELMNEFRVANAGNERVVYAEKVVNNSEDTVGAIRLMERFDLFIVGKGQGKETIMTAGLQNWSEYPELGPIGDLLVSADSGITSSVLVLQQYNKTGTGTTEGTPVTALAMTENAKKLVGYLRNASQKFWKMSVGTDSNRGSFR